jgi:heme/copper-type cytochrome/quinol oxidase subunit 2
MTKQTLPTTHYPTLVPEPFKANDAQKEREAALKRFNRRYVLAPVIAISVISILVIVFMIGIVLVMAFSDEMNAQYLSFLSGLADITIIMFTIPMIILMISGPLMLAGMINMSRKRRKLGKPAFDQGGSLQVLLWKMDNLIEKSQTKTNEVAPQMAEQIIRFNESIAYAQGFFKQITSYFKRS